MSWKFCWLTGLIYVDLESFSLKNTFKQVAFYIEIEKHIEDPIMQKALEELGFHCETLRQFWGVMSELFYRFKIVNSQPTSIL